MEPPTQAILVPKAPQAITTAAIWCVAETLTPLLGYCLAPKRQINAIVYLLTLHAQVPILSPI